MFYGTSNRKISFTKWFIKWSGYNNIMHITILLLAMCMTPSVFSIFVCNQIVWHSHWCNHFSDVAVFRFCLDLLFPFSNNMLCLRKRIKLWHWGWIFLNQSIYLRSICMNKYDLWFLWYTILRIQLENCPQLISLQQDQLEPIPISKMESYSRHYC